MRSLIMKATIEIPNLPEDFGEERVNKFKEDFYEMLKAEADETVNIEVSAEIQTKF